jgi:hypothetical protein
MKEGFLHSYFLKNNKRLIHKWSHYFDIYERHFNRFVDEEIILYEIGIFQGGSAQMWKSYFGERAKIVGIDIDPKCRKFADKNLSVEIGNQSDISFLEKVVEKHGKPNIVIDDGSHIMSDMIKSFEYLYYRTDENGVYLIEDTHTSYWDEYQGGYKKQNTIIEFVKDKLDEMNAVHTRGKVAKSDFTRQTDSINFYDSVVVFERKPQIMRTDMKTGFIDSTY